MEKIKHLYWRAGFGLSPDEWQERRNWQASRAVDELFRDAATVSALPVAPPPDVDPRELDRAELQELMQEDRRLVGELNVDWVGRMASPRHPALVERMSLFWHGHFACRSLGSRLAAGQLNVLRTHGLGNFRDLALGIARDPSMIRYLNNQQNRKEQPNENFARELLELFTIGRGNYTEQDIREAARAFTGWSSNLRGEFVFRALQHDYGRKTFFGKSGFFNGDDIIDLILERRETARFLAAKIYRYFVNERVDEAIVSDLADQFYRSDYDIGRLMRTIFSSDWFYRPENTGARIKGPVEFLAGLMRTLDVELSPRTALLPIQKGLGQMLFNPPNVAGWPGGRSWIDNATLTMRLNLPGALYRSAELDFRPKAEPEDAEAARRLGKLSARVQLQPLAGLVKGQSEGEAIAELQKYLLLTPPAADLDFLRRYAGQVDGDDFVARATLGLLSLPEYQMC